MYTVFFKFFFHKRLLSNLSRDGVKWLLFPLPTKMSVWTNAGGNVSLMETESRTILKVKKLYLIHFNRKLLYFNSTLRLLTLLTQKLELWKCKIRCTVSRNRKHLQHIPFYSSSESARSEERHYFLICRIRPYSLLTFQGFFRMLNFCFQYILRMWLCCAGWKHSAQ